MKRNIISLALLIAVCVTQAATLEMRVARLNAANGDRMQYRLPGQNWITVDPAYTLHRVPNIPNNWIVSVRVYNFYQQRTISTSVKATWCGNGGDANSDGIVKFNVTGTG